MEFNIRGIRNLGIPKTGFSPLTNNPPRFISFVAAALHLSVCLSMEEVYGGREGEGESESNS